jgi:hypothetical protein
VYEIRFATGVGRTSGGSRHTIEAEILDAIEKQLPYQATIPSRHRKLLINLVPPWTAVPPIWELRVGLHRVFYDLSKPRD